MPPTPSISARSATTSIATARKVPCPSLDHQFEEVGFRYRKHPSMIELATGRVVGELVKQCTKCSLVLACTEPYLEEKARVFEFRRRARDVFGWSLRD